MDVFAAPPKQKQESNSTLQRTKKCMCLNFDGDNNISKLSLCSNCDCECPHIPKTALNALGHVDVYLEKMYSESALDTAHKLYKLKTKSGTCLKKNFVDLSSSVIREIFVNPVEPIKSELFQLCN